MRRPTSREKVSLAQKVRARWSISKAPASAALSASSWRQAFILNSSISAWTRASPAWAASRASARAVTSCEMPFSANIRPRRSVRKVARMVSQRPSRVSSRCSSVAPSPVVTPAVKAALTTSRWVSSIWAKNCSGVEISSDDQPNRVSTSCDHSMRSSRGSKLHVPMRAASDSISWVRRAASSSAFSRRASVTSRSVPIMSPLGPRRERPSSHSQPPPLRATCRQLVAWPSRWRRRTVSAASSWLSGCTKSKTGCPIRSSRDQPVVRSQPIPASTKTPSGEITANRSRALSKNHRAVAESIPLRRFLVPAPAFFPVIGSPRFQRRQCSEKMNAAFLSGGVNQAEKKTPPLKNAAFIFSEHCLRWKRGEPMTGKKAGAGTRKRRSGIDSATARWFFDNALDLFAVISPDGVFVEAGIGWERTTGWSREDLIGQPVFDFVHPDSQDEAADTVRRLHRDGHATNCLQVARKGGGWLWLEGRSRLGPNGDMIGTLRDVTDALREKAELEAARRTQLMLSEAARIGTWSFEPRDERIEWSQDVLTLFGWSSDEISTPEQFFAQIDETQRDVVSAAFTAGVTTGEGATLEHRLLTRDGRWLTMRATFRTERRGRMFALKGISQDVTALAEAHDAAQAGEARVQALMDEFRMNAWRQELALSAAEAGAFEIDHRARTFWASETFSRLVGRRMTYGEVAQPVWGFVHVEDRELVRDTNTRWMEGAENVSMEFRIHMTDGAERWVRVFYRLDRPTRKGVGLILDIDARKRQELALVEAQRAAEAGAEAKARFLANMSHEIRTPMNGVIGVLHLLKNEPVSADGRRLLDEALSCGAMLSTLLDDVIDFERIEAGRLDLPGAAAAVPVQPDRQRCEVHPVRRRHRPLRSARARPAGLRGQRHRRRHPSGRPGPAVRALPPGRRLDHPPVRRLGPGPGHHPAAGRDDGRGGRLPVGARPGLDLPAGDRGPGGRGARRDGGCRGAGAGRPAGAGRRGQSHQPHHRRTPAREPRCNGPHRRRRRLRSRGGGAVRLRPDPDGHPDAGHRRAGGGAAHPCAARSLGADADPGPDRQRPLPPARDLSGRGDGRGGRQADLARRPAHRDRPPEPY